MATVLLPVLLLVLSDLALTVGDEQLDQNGYTLLSPGKSYLEYHISWPRVQDIQFELTFRTLTIRTMLLHHTFLEIEGEYRPELKVMLDKGILVVEHRYGDIVERLPIAKGMSHDKWHKIKVVLSLEKKEVRAQVADRPERTKGLKALVDPKAMQAYQGGPRTSVVFIGGYPPESLQQPSSFVGCFKDILFGDGNGQVSAELYDKSHTESGCVSACDVDNPCQHGGKCVNLYTAVECDCFQTNHHGEHCEKEGLTTVTLAGDEWIRYNLYDDVETERSHLPGIRIAIDFRTSAPEGVLFYASETYPQYNHVAVSLYNGTVHVSVVFEDRETHSELYTTIGKDLNDGRLIEILTIPLNEITFKEANFTYGMCNVDDLEQRWHSLTLIHEGKEVKIQVDGDVTDMDAKHSHPHLNMPEMIYYAGIEEGYPGIGLRSQQTFLGCIRNLYFNHIAVLDHLDDRAYYHGNSPLEYKCQDVHTTSMQYQHDGSYVRILSDEKKDMIVEFEFRTYKPDALLFHTDMGRYDYKGYIKGFLVGGKFELHIVPSGYHGDDRQVLTLGTHLNQAQWHSVKVFCNSGLVQLWVNREFTVQQMKWNLNVGKATYFGYAPDIFDEKRSYIGCMRHIVVQGEHVDPLPLIKSENSVGVSVGSCDLVDWCAEHNPCLNNGLCVSEWYRTYCDCGPTHHEGRLCQFPMLKRSCDDYYLSGYRTSGVHIIDIDANGPLKPVYVYCQFGVVVDGRKHGVTQVEHNLQPQTVVRAPELSSMRKELEYRSMTRKVLNALIRSSSQCRQQITLNCYQAALGLGKQTVFRSARNKTVSHIGAAKDGSCQCHTDGTCLSRKHSCNCDTKSKKWLSDSGYIVNKDELPIVEMTFLQDLGGRANVTLGPLECMGKDLQSSEDTAMFTAADSYFDLEGWKGGNLEFIFRTLQAPAILLYQHGQNSSHQDVQLSIVLVNDHKLVLKCFKPLIEVALNTSIKLTSGDWHLVQLNAGNNQLRVSVADEKKIIDLPDGIQSPGIYSTRLYVGNKPMKHPKEFPGLVGCIGRLVYNDRPHSLKHIADTKIGVHLGCPSQCEAEPCKNGATCVEKWDSYQCKCSNIYAHSGESCEHNINTNSVKFLSTDRYLYFFDADLEVLGSDYYLSFRTNDDKALLLYVFDDNNNFVQMDVEDGEVFHLSYNAGHDIKHATAKVSGLTDGNWKQVAVWSEQGLLKLYVDGLIKEYEDERMPLSTYSQVPFKDPESVVPTRNVYPPQRGVHIYVGGIPSQFVGPDGIRGCLRGLKIGDQLLDLQTVSDGKEGFLPGCPSGCEASPCKHGGRCYDDVDFSDGYSCDCSGTGYAGIHCNGEVGVYFNKDSGLEEVLNAKDISAVGGYEARLELAFATSVQDAMKTAIGFVRGRTGLSDYMLIYLTQVDNKVFVAADVQLEDKTVSLIDGKHTADGSPHSVVLERKASKVTLKVDDDIHQAVFQSVSQSYDNLGIIDIGWVRKDNFRFTEYDNFTGDIWNVFFTSDMLSTINARPLEVYNGYNDGNNGITVMGSLAPVTQSLYPASYQYMYGDSIWKDGQGSDYPAWNPGPARTVILTGANEEEFTTPGPSPAIAFVVCGLALFFFLGLTLCLVLRHRSQTRQNGPHSAKSIEEFTDEEEQLLRKINPKVLDGLVEEEPIKMARLRQGPRKGKSGSGTEDDENEETPMLHNEVPMAESAPGENIQMEKFEKQIPEISPEEEYTGIDNGQASSASPTNANLAPEEQEQVKTRPRPDGSQPPPKPPRLSTIEATPPSDQTVPSSQVTEQSSTDNIQNNVETAKDASVKPGTNIAEDVIAQTSGQMTRPSAADDESGEDEGNEDIEIKAEVHIESPPDGSLNSQPSSPLNKNTEVNQPATGVVERKDISPCSEGNNTDKLQTNSIH